MEIRKVENNGQVLALFFSKKLKVNEKGIRFLTPTDYPLQIGLLEHPKKKIVPPHIHRNLHYNVNTTQEFLFVQKGSDIEVTIFSDEWKCMEKISMSSGDSILFVSGGHSLIIPKGCKILEVKQGPYPGDKEAKIFRE